MYIKVFPHGKGNGKSPTHYLVRLDYPNRKESPPVVVRGDVEETQRLIDSLETKWKFTAGVLSWHPNDVVSPEKEQEIIDALKILLLQDWSMTNAIFYGYDTAMQIITNCILSFHEWNFMGARHIIPALPVGRNLLICCVIISISKKIGQNLTTRNGQDYICQNRLT